MIMFLGPKNLLATLTYFTTDTTSTCVDISGELECFVPLEKIGNMMFSCGIECVYNTTTSNMLNHGEAIFSVRGF